MHVSFWTENVALTLKVFCFTRVTHGRVQQVHSRAQTQSGERVRRLLQVRHHVDVLVKECVCPPAREADDWSNWLSADMETIR